MKKYLQYYRFIIIDIFCTISCKAGCTADGNTINCNCNLSLPADSVTFNNDGELIFVNSKFNFEKETEHFQNYTKTSTNMEELNPVNLQDDGNNRKKIYLYILKVGYSPIGKYYCFKYDNKIYILREDNGKYLLPIAKRNNDKSFDKNIDWVCILGHDNNLYFLLIQKFEDNKDKALILDDFISTNKFKSKDIDKEVTILDEKNKENESLNKNNGTITINDIHINIGTINNINSTQNISQSINIVKK